MSHWKSWSHLVCDSHRFVGWCLLVCCPRRWGNTCICEFVIEFLGILVQWDCYSLCWFFIFIYFRIFFGFVSCIQPIYELIDIDVSWCMFPIYLQTMAQICILSCLANANVEAGPPTAAKLDGARYDQVLAINGHGISSMDDLPEVAWFCLGVVRWGDSHSTVVAWSGTPH